MRKLWSLMMQREAERHKKEGGERERKGKVIESQMRTQRREGRHRHPGPGLKCWSPAFPASDSWTPVNCTWSGGWGGFSLQLVGLIYLGQRVEPTAVKLHWARACCCWLRPSRALWSPTQHSVMPRSWRLHQSRPQSEDDAEDSDGLGMFIRNKPIPA